MSTILIAEDDLDVRFVLERVFSRAGFTVLAEPDGVSALSRARTDHPDIVLTDFDMPGMDGLDLCRAIRQDPDLTDIPVLLLSGRVQPGDPRLEAAHLCGVLLKPFSNAALVAEVQRLAGQGRHNHAPGEPACAGR